MAKKKKYTLTVEYHQSPSTDVDEIVESIASKDNCTGSGYGFGTRDITFEFAKQKDFADSLMAITKMIKDGMQFDVKTGRSLAD
jgi:hypothetical protein